MTTSDIKIELIKWLSNIENAELLSKLKQAKDDLIFEEESKSMVIGYRPNNAPVIKSEFLRCIQQAEHQVENGEFTYLENFEVEIEKW